MITTDVKRNFLLLTLSLLTAASSQSALAASSLSSISIKPSSVIASEATATISVAVTEACPAGGCAVNLSSSNAILPVPAYITIPEGALSAAAIIVAGKNTSSSSINLVVSANMGGVSKSMTAWVNAALVGPYLVSMSTNVVSYIFPGQIFSLTMKVSEACPAGGCLIPLYNANSSLIKAPTTFTIPAGETQATLSVIVGNTLYPSTVNFSSTFNKVSRSLSVSVFAPLGVVAADGSFIMKAFGSSSRTGTGSITVMLNDTLARSNLNSQISGSIHRQCRTINPNGELIGLEAPVRVGEYRNASGLLTYDYTQNLKCSSIATRGAIKSMTIDSTSVNVGTPFTLTVCLHNPVASNALISLKTTNGSGLPLPATMTIPAGTTCGAISLKATSGGYTTNLRGTLNYIMHNGPNFTIY